jgi:hypothetical protein
MQTTDLNGLKRLYEFANEGELQKRLIQSMQDDNVRTIKVYKDGLNRKQRRKKAAEERKSGGA